MLRTGLALMMAGGFRPEVREKHLTVVKFVSVVMGIEFKRLLNDYDSMRRKRHRLIYEPDIPCSIEEAKASIQTAKKFIDTICIFLKQNNPQLEIDFKKRTEKP